MLGKESHIGTLKSHKQLLIAESELNRVQLSQEWQKLPPGVGGLVRQGKTIGGLIFSTVLIAAGIKAFNRKPSKPRKGKFSWFQSIVNGANMAAKVGLAFRALRIKRNI